MLCVYAIKILDSYYVGATTDYTKRKVAHKSQLKNKKHKNKKLQDAFDKNEKHKFIVLKECSSLKQLRAYENYYIGYYTALGNCFNVIISTISIENNNLFDINSSNTSNFLKDGYCTLDQFINDNFGLMNDTFKTNVMNHIIKNLHLITSDDICQIGETIICKTSNLKIICNNYF